MLTRDMLTLLGIEEGKAVSCRGQGTGFIAAIDQNPSENCLFITCKFSQTSLKVPAEFFVQLITAQVVKLDN